MNTNEQMRSHFVAIHDVIKKYITKEINDTSLCLRIKNIVNKALALPRRNCDVGTAEEQEERFDEFCFNHGNGDICQQDCPCLYEPGACKMMWAQLPYEKGENDE